MSNSLVFTCAAESAVVTLHIPSAIPSHPLPPPSPAISSSTFTGCAAIQSGGAISITNSPSATLTDVSITSSHVSYLSSVGGGALALVNVTTASLANFQASSCHAMASEGGALYVESSSLQVTGAAFNSCRATEGGAVSSYSSTIVASDMSFQDCQVSGGRTPETVALLLSVLFLFHKRSDRLWRPSHAPRACPLSFSPHDPLTSIAVPRPPGC